MNSILIATNFTFTYTWRKWLITIHTEERIGPIQIHGVALFHSDLKKFNSIQNYSFRYYNLQLSNSIRFICVYLIFHNITFKTVLKLMFRLKLVLVTCAGFFNIPGEYENVIFIIKNPLNFRDKYFLKLHS